MGVCVKVRASGGLFVIGMSVAESRRIENQLRVQCILFLLKDLHLWFREEQVVKEIQERVSCWRMFRIICSEHGTLDVRHLPLLDLHRHVLPLAIRLVLDDASNSNFVKIEGGIAQIVINNTRNQLEDVYRNGRRSVCLWRG